MKETTTTKCMDKISESTAAEIKETLITLLDQKAEMFLTVEGLDIALCCIDKYTSDEAGETYIRMAANAASKISAMIERLAEYAKTLDVCDMNKLLDVAKNNTEYQLFTPELVLDIKRKIVPDVSAVVIDSLGRGVYNWLKWQIDKLNEMLFKADSLEREIDWITLQANKVDKKYRKEAENE